MTDKRDSSLPRCSNANAGTFNHECGKPASWAGKQRSRLNPTGFHVQYFCDDCRDRGDEARTVVDWTRVGPLADGVIRSNPALLGRAAYEASLVAAPLYHDGKPRRTWEQLGAIERMSWERAPRAA